MARGANLSGKDGPFANYGRTGESDLAAEHGVGSDFAGVTDQDEVVDFCAAADASFANGGAIDARVGLNFDVVFENDDAGLDNLIVRAQTAEFCTMSRLFVWRSRGRRLR